jgi:hypothetical protein
MIMKSLRFRCYIKVFILYRKRRRTDVLLVITSQTIPAAQRARHGMPPATALALRCPVDALPVGEARE